MRILFAGIPEFGTICLRGLLDAKKNVVAILLPPFSHPTYKTALFNAKVAKIPALKIDGGLKTPTLIENVKKYEPDLIIIASYPRLIPPEIYSIPKLGAVNCHPSLLPQYRGPNPYFYVLRHGQQETGITFHYLDESFDTGNIIEQWRVPIFPDDTLGTLYLRLSLQSSDLYLKLLEKIEKEGLLSSYEQCKEHENLFYCKELAMDDEQLNIPWNHPVASIDALVRAGNPYYGASTFFRQAPMKVFSGYPLKKAQKLPQEKPGTIVRVSHNELIVSAGEGFYAITCLQYAMLYTCDIREFIKRNNPKVGEILY